MSHDRAAAILQESIESEQASIDADQLQVTKHREIIDRLLHQIEERVKRIIELKKSQHALTLLTGDGGSCLF